MRLRVACFVAAAVCAGCARGPGDALDFSPSTLPAETSQVLVVKPVPPGPGNPLGTRWMGI